MIQGCYYACILKQKRGGDNLYLYKLGTDQLERLFGNIRTITHARNCDSLELCQRLSHAESIEAKPNIQFGREFMGRGYVAIKIIHLSRSGLVI